MSNVTWIPVDEHLPSEFTRRYYVTLYSQKTNYKFYVDTLYFNSDGTWEKRRFRSIQGETVIAWAQKPDPVKMAKKEYVKPKLRCEDEIGFGSRDDPEAGWCIQCELMIGHEGVHQASDTGDSEQPFLLQWVTDERPEPYRILPARLSHEAQP